VTTAEVNSGRLTSLGRVTTGIGSVMDAPIFMGLQLACNVLDVVVCFVVV